MNQKMLRILFFGVILSVFQGVAFGQARVQMIHNSADTAHRFFDVWIGTTRVFNNLEFRSATAFVDVPVTSQITIVLTDSASTGPQNPIAIYRRTFEDNRKYLLVIDGLVSPEGYDPYFELGFDVYDFAREEASAASKTDLLFLHGATDAPEVDLVEGNIGLISNNLSYGDFDGYFGFAPADYMLFVKDNVTQTTLYSYELPLVSLGMQGKAGVVLMSGFTDTPSNNMGEPFGLYLALPEGGSLIQLPVYNEPMAPLQFIHNSPNMSADSLDIWIDGRLAVNNMKFRTATAFNSQPAGRSLQVAVCSAGSVNPSDPIISANLLLVEDQPVQIVLSGLTQPAGYTPPTPVALHVYQQARVGAVIPGNTDLLFCNGSTDFGPLKVVETTTTIGTLTENLSFGQFDGYKEVLAANYVFEVRNETNEPVAVYDASLLNIGLVSQSATVLASGFLDKAANNNGPAFGLFLVPQGGGDLIGLPPYTPPTYADIQLIHNSGDLNCDTLDVWVNDEKVVGGLVFRSASPFISVDAGVQLTVAVQPRGSVSAANPMASEVFVPEAGKKYAFVINGIFSPSGYNPAPSFALTMIENIRENAVSGGVVDVMVCHQSTDAPSPADFVELNGVWLLGMEYGQHSNYMQKPVADYSLGFRHPDSLHPFRYYFLPVADWGLSGKTVMVFTSGFFNPLVNSNGAAFGLWAVVPGGEKMVELTDATGIMDDSFGASFSVYPNPAAKTVRVQLLKGMNANCDIRLFNTSGRLISNMQVMLADGTAAFDVSTLSAGTYIIGLTVDGFTAFKTLQIAR